MFIKKERNMSIASFRRDRCSTYILVDAEKDIRGADRRYVEEYSVSARCSNVEHSLCENL